MSFTNKVRPTLPSFHQALLPPIPTAELEHRSEAPTPPPAMTSSANVGVDSKVLAEALKEAIKEAAKDQDKEKKINEKREKRSTGVSLKVSPSLPALVCPIFNTTQVH